MSSITILIFLLIGAFFTGNLRAFGAQTPSSKPVNILAFGDSITAGYRLDPSKAFPQLLENELRQQGIAAKVINAGISGDTSLQGLQRISWVLKNSPPIDLLLLELGANDGLRGLSIPEMEQHLRQIIREFKSRGTREIVLFGMKTTKNQTTDYQRQFQSTFPRLAQKEHIHYLPFFLEKVAFRPEWTLEDLIHPNEKGHELLARGLAEFLKREGILARLQAAEKSR
jgi:acyl-CoA thioesterase-1